MNETLLARILDAARHLVERGEPSTEGRIYHYLEKQVTHETIVKARTLLVERGEWVRLPGQMRTRAEAAIERRKAHAVARPEGPCWREIEDARRAERRIRRIGAA